MPVKGFDLYPFEWDLTGDLAIVMRLEEGGILIPWINVYKIVIKNTVKALVFKTMGE
jgi:hypothetical protein